MKVLFGGVAWYMSERDIYDHRNTYQYGWEFMRDGELSTEDLHHHVWHCEDAKIASAIIKSVAKRFATDEDFRNSILKRAWDVTGDEPSIQVEDDEDKPLMEATSKTTEDTHGGDEATKSIEDSPSAANEGKEENNENSSEAADGNSKDEMSSEREEVDGREKPTSVAHGSMQHNVADIISAIEEQPFDDHGALQKALDHVVRHIKGREEGGIAKGWDGRKMVKHLISKQLNRIPNDRKRTGVCKTVVVAVDCSGSCWEYLGTINKSLQKLSKTHKVVVVDVSNGFNLDHDVYIHDDDPYANRRQLEEAFCDGSHIVMHETFTTPSYMTAASLAENAEAMIIIADYDGYKSIAKSVQLIRNHSKYPWFIDLETRYNDPSEHDWNCSDDRDWSEDDWPAAARNRWLKLFPRHAD